MLHAIFSFLHSFFYNPKEGWNIFTVKYLRCSTADWSHGDQAKPSPILLLQIRFYMQPPSSLTHIFHPLWTIIFLYLTFILPIKFSVSCLKKQVWTCRCGSQEANGKNYVLSWDTMWSSGYQPSHRNMLPLLNMLLKCFRYGSGQIIFTLQY
jgi:hypothetical protein